MKKEALLLIDPLARPFWDHVQLKNVKKMYTEQTNNRRERVRI
jgi:hypothetical protein